MSGPENPPSGAQQRKIDEGLETLEQLAQGLGQLDALRDLLSELVVDNTRLQKDNRRLSEALIKQTQGGGDALKTVKAAQEKVRVAQIQVQDLLEENTDLNGRILELEELNGSMMSMYVASYRLHATLDLDEVVATIEEIIVNFIGANAYAILLANPEGSFDVVADRQLDGRLARSGVEPRGVLAEVVGSRVAYVHTSERPAREGVIAAVPLAMGRDVVGAVVLYELLSQKDRLLRNDVELLSLLGGHAASALVSARLYARADRKLKTLQGMIELLQR